jgi:hypothetical protein
LTQSSTFGVESTSEKRADEEERDESSKMRKEKKAKQNAQKLPKRLCGFEAA